MKQNINHYNYTVLTVNMIIVNIMFVSIWNRIEDSSRTILKNSKSKKQARKRKHGNETEKQFLPNIEPTPHKASKQP